jgi:hypothetical protein
MTSKESFKNNMIRNGLKVTETENTLTMISANGKMETTYYFNEKGDLIDWTTKNF